LIHEAILEARWQAAAGSFHYGKRKCLNNRKRIGRKPLLYIGVGA
jgi:hypothetical protein